MKILKFMVMVLFFVLSINYVSADTFVKGEFIAGEYISKVKNNKTHYLTIQYIKDSEGRAVFCLEPFVNFESGKDYQEYLWDDEDYYGLSDDVKRKIELITYYGYGYKNRTSHKWYAITQYLIWINVDMEADIYFTDKVNGKKITKYEDEINQIMDDVNNHDIAPLFSTGIEINLGDEVRIDNFFEEFNIYENDFLWENSNNTLVIRDLKDDIVLEFYRISNYHDKDVVLFVSDEYQDLIRPGNVNEPKFEVPIKIKKGKIGLDIINNSINKPYIKLSTPVFEALNKLMKFNYERIYNVINATKENGYYEEMF